jgi:hypothetical protein
MEKSKPYSLSLENKKSVMSKDFYDAKNKIVEDGMDRGNGWSYAESCRNNGVSLEDMLDANAYYYPEHGEPGNDLALVSVENGGELSIQNGSSVLLADRALALTVIMKDFNYISKANGAKGDHGSARMHDSYGNCDGDVYKGMQGKIYYCGAEVGIMVDILNDTKGLKNSGFNPVEIEVVNDGVEGDLWHDLGPDSGSKASDRNKVIKRMSQFLPGENK